MNRDLVKNGTWYQRNGTSGSNAMSSGGFSISPAFKGQTEWKFSEDGELNIGYFGEYTIIPFNDFTATVKMWGGGGATSGNNAIGGGAGYSTATITFRRNTPYVLRIGQGGSEGTASASGATYLSGGAGTTITGSTEGGGYTGIFKESVLQANALLMAGGGGGGGGSVAGGAGGGSSGGAGAGTSGQQGGGGTQLAGGAASTLNGATAGSALTGGIGQTTSGAAASQGGGGGGYFGGGGGNTGGGGGGSGRISSDADVTGGTTTAGSGNTVANSSDADRLGAGQGGSATQGGNNTLGRKGRDGRLVIRV
jgi:hypothetical protein